MPDSAPPSDDALNCYLLGTLPPPETAQVDAWLSNTDVLARLTRLAPRDALIADLSAASSAPQLPPEQVGRILEAVGRSFCDDTTGNSPATSPGMAGALTGASPFPARFGAYRILRELGRGGMGVVLEAYDESLDRSVALKVMNVGPASESRAKTRFLREAKAVAAVRHDHVVPIYHVGEQEGIPFLVMPLLTGESLDARLRTGKLTLAEVLQVGREAADGLAAAHAVGIVHRDIKPGNLWLESKNDSSAPKAERPAADSGFRVKILDFGLARVRDGADALTQPGAVLGTAAYMAPEQADGHEVDARADLFSLGAVLYQCATGKRAFGGETFVATLKSVSTYTPPPPHTQDATIPRALSDLIMQLLAKNPAERPATAREVADQLASFAIPGVTTPSQSPASRNAKRNAGIAIAAALMIGLGAWALSGSKAPTDSAAVTPTPELTPPANPPGKTPENAPEIPKYKGSVDILVQRQDDGSERALPLWDSRSMPLVPGDNFRIEANIDQPAYLYIFWIDETGTGVPVYPWKKLGKWDSRQPDQEKPETSVVVRNSSGGTSFRISGKNAGTETILLIANPTPLTLPDEAIKNWFAGLKPLTFRNEKSRAWFENFDLLRDPLERDKRAITDPGDEQIDGPIGLQAELGRRIGKNAAYSRAISFSRLSAGKPEGK